MELSAATNLLAPAFYLLKEKGYHVYYEKDQDWWVAEKPAVKLIGYNTTELCGLAYIYEAKGNNWAVSDEAVDDFMELE